MALGISSFNILDIQIVVSTVWNGIQCVETMIKHSCYFNKLIFSFSLYEYVDQGDYRA